MSKSFRNFARTSRVAGTAPRLRQSETVDYVAVAGLKWRALRVGFEAFKARCDAGRRQDFEKFRAERGDAAVALRLLRGAAPQVQDAVVGMAGAMAAARRHQHARNCARAPDAAEIEFVEFVQWNADRQLRRLQALAPTGSA